jgi:hypothetical protein
MEFKMFYKTLEDLTFDLGLWRWNGKEEIITTYSAKQSRKLLKPRRILHIEMWEACVFLSDFQLKWMDV